MEKSGSDNLEGEDASKFSTEQFFDRNKIPLASFLVGLILIGFGVLMYKGGYMGSGDRVEILNASEKETGNNEAKKQIVVEISGSVEKPGVYKFDEGSRVEDLLIASGGVSADADRSWVEKYINRAAKLTDGQKIFIFSQNDLAKSDDYQSSLLGARNETSIKLDQNVLGVNSSGMVNINTASLSELDTLPGIGQVYGQKIIDHRPYSSLDELVAKGALKQSVYEKVKDKISIY